MYSISWMLKILREVYTACSQMNLGVECWRSQITSLLSIPPVAAIGTVAKLGENFTNSTDSVWEVRELTICLVKTSRIQLTLFWSTTCSKDIRRTFDNWDDTDHKPIKQTFPVNRTVFWPTDSETGVWVNVLQETKC